MNKVSVAGRGASRLRRDVPLNRVARVRDGLDVRRVRSRMGNKPRVAFKRLFPIPHLTLAKGMGESQVADAQRVTTW